MDQWELIECHVEYKCCVEQDRRAHIVRKGRNTDHTDEIKLVSVNENIAYAFKP